MHGPANIIPREQSRGEELANALSHGLGALAALIATPLLILRALEVGTASFVVGVGVFGASMLFLYLASTLYHALPVGTARRVFWRLDHAGIFLLIAGTYTPFTLGVLSGGWGWTLFGLVWGFAAIGVLLKATAVRVPPWLSTLVYLAMGWLVVLAVEPLLDRVPPAGLAWLLAGGLFYTAGVVFFATDHRLRYGHFVWHLFVLAGTLCHCVAIWGWGAPI
jgi:hemolysin III